MYNHILCFETRQQAESAVHRLISTSIDCSNIQVNEAQLSFQTTYRLEELTRLALRSDLQATSSTFNEVLPYHLVVELGNTYEAGLRAINGKPTMLFTEQARTVLRLAEKEAQRFHHNYIGTEHLLLGLVSEGESVGSLVLASLGVELQKGREAVDFIVGRGNANTHAQIHLTSRAKQVIKLAASEARRLNQHAIGTEHLLLGLVLEGEGMGAGVLESLGVSLEKVRRHISEAVSPFGMPDGSSEEDLEEEEASDGTGDILFFLDLAVKLLAGAGLCLMVLALLGAVLCLVATLLVLVVVIARLILLLLEH